MSMKKKASAAIAVTAAAAIALSGTLAYFTSTSVTNKVTGNAKPLTKEVTPHDDFDGVNKDVYMENLGTTKVWVRVQLTEDFKMSGLYGEGGEKYFNYWQHYDKHDTTGLPYGGHLHNGNDGDVTDCTTGNKDLSDFHNTYFAWTMGGTGKDFLSASSKLYLDDAKGEDGTDADGVYMGGDENKVAKDDYGNGVESLESVKAEAQDAYDADGEKGDAKLADWITAKMEETNTKLAEENAKDEKDEATITQLEADLAKYQTWSDAVSAVITAPDCTVISMADYQNLTESQKKDFAGWVMDTDGWYYWSQAVEPGESTGLLLNQVDTLEKLASEKYDYHYHIHVNYEAVDSTDIGLWNTADQKTDSEGNEVGNRQASDAAKALLKIAGALDDVEEKPLSFNETSKDGTYAYSADSLSKGVFFNTKTGQYEIGTLNAENNVEKVTTVAGRQSGVMMSTGEGSVVSGNSIAKIGKVKAADNSGNYYYTIVGAKETYHVTAGKDGKLGTLDDEITAEDDKLGVVNDSNLKWNYLGGTASNMYLLASTATSEATDAYAVTAAKNGRLVQAAQLYETYEKSMTGGSAIKTTNVGNFDAYKAAGVTQKTAKFFMASELEMTKAFMTDASRITYTASGAVREYIVRQVGEPQKFVGKKGAMSTYSSKIDAALRPACLANLQ